MTACRSVAISAPTAEHSWSSSAASNARATVSAIASAFPNRCRTSYSSVLSPEVSTDSARKARVNFERCVAPMTGRSRSDRIHALKARCQFEGGLLCSYPSLMGAEAEAPGDVLTGSTVASATEGKAGAPAQSDAHDACRNCGAILHGRYCSACAQPAHIHRSLVSLGHDILHGVFHFEGKIWRTIPELCFHPGRLTRRYIDGERAKFISPMALFLFTVFLMFLVFSITGGALMDRRGSVAGDSETNLMTSIPGDWKSSARRSVREADTKIESLRGQLNAGDLSPERRATLTREIGDLQTAREAMDAVAKKEWSRFAELDRKSKSTAAAPEGIRAEDSKPADAEASSRDNDPKVELGWPALDRRLTEGLRELNENPRLLLYKLKSNGYKFSWALIPMSLPFLWLMFFWRRDIYIYDHAIFVTYSISFVALLLILLSTGAAAGVSRDIWEPAMVFVPPIHLYRQLRDAYGVSRLGAWVRLFLLQVSIAIVLVLFSALLLLFGVLD
jgi:hypothetical protein